MLLLFVVFFFGLKSYISFTLGHCRRDGFKIVDVFAMLSV